MNHLVTLCIGSNCGDRAANIASAIERIGSVAASVWLSPLCESADITGRGPSYLNRVLKCTTALELSDFRDRIATFEAAGGRLPASKASGNMPIDIDIVVWDGEVLSPSDYASDYFRQCIS